MRAEAVVGHDVEQTWIDRHDMQPLHRVPWLVRSHTVRDMPVPAVRVRDALELAVLWRPLRHGCRGASARPDCTHDVFDSAAGLEFAARVVLDLELEHMDSVAALILLCWFQARRAKASHQAVH